MCSTPARGWATRRMALARHATQVTTVELDPVVHTIIRQNPWSYTLLHDAQCHAADRGYWRDDRGLCRHRFRRHPARPAHVQPGRRTLFACFLPATAPRAATGRTAVSLHRESREPLRRHRHARRHQAAGARLAFSKCRSDRRRSGLRPLLECRGPFDKPPSKKLRLPGWRQRTSPTTTTCSLASEIHADSGQRRWCPPPAELVKPTRPCRYCSLSSFML
jgi:hypothetical protein